MSQKNRIVLRKITIDDASIMFNNYCTNENVTKYLMWYPHKNVDETIQYINYVNSENTSGQVYGICLADSIETIIGHVQIGIKNSYAMIAYVLDESYWRQGIMSEVISTLITEYSTDYDVKVFNAIVDVRNTGSIKLLEKLNFDLIETIYEKEKVDSLDHQLIECYRYQYNANKTTS